MFRFPISLILLSTAIALSSCAGIPEQKFVTQTTFKQDNLQQVKSIALLDVPNPPHYYLGGGVGPATFFLGALGAAAELSAVGKDTKEYADFDFAAISQRGLKKYLELKGYHVTSVSVNRDNPHALLGDYSLLNVTGVDAFLDLAPVEVGFKRKTWAGPFAREVGPHVSVVVRLVSADSKEILYEESVQYGYDKNPFAAGTRIDAPTEHRFKNTDAMKSEKESAIDQLEQGINAISHVISEKLSQ